ncbi:MAG: 4'-phosphopantetheinyl transferase superfamily protein [Bacteroidales bacterium]|nr:4'-phosphopantetheinyl transferase superfamily protein [Bacteroidales bacterium]
MRISHYHISGIDIYVGDFDGACPDTLSPSQKEEVATMASDKRRRERTVVYALINHAAVDNPERYDAIAGMPLCHFANGAPYFNSPDGQESEIGISVSHCHSGACIAVSRPAKHFGIDIEDQSPKLERVKSKYIGDSEAIFIGAERLLPAWTIKEAVYKAAGIAGLSLRDGIIISKIAEVAADFSLEATVAINAGAPASGATIGHTGTALRCHIRRDASRCIALAVSDGQERITKNS